MVEALMENLKSESRPPEIEQIIYRYNTSESEFILHYMNSKLRLYDDTELDHVEWHQNERQSKFRVPDKLWQRLLDSRFPFSFYPNETIQRFWENPKSFSSPPTPTFHDDYEPLPYIDRHTGRVLMSWANTRMRLYGEPEYNHVEIRLVHSVDKVRGITDLTKSEWQTLFRNGYPIEYLPTVELDQQTKQWFERRSHE